MDRFELPEAVISRFRAAAFERLERIETAWAALTHGGGTRETEENLSRDVHTLKGDARVVGFHDVGLLCQRLEDIFAAAKAHRYTVHDDVDMVVTMATQFAAMLLRRKASAPRGGIDLDGFVKQIDDVLAEWLRRRSSAAPAQAQTGTILLRALESHDRVSGSARDRLSVAATAVFLEHLRGTTGASRSRLRDIWLVLAREIALLDFVPLAPVLQHQAAAAEELARELGKQVAVVCDAGEVAVSPEVREAINTVVVHAVRNAVDHGVAPPDVRLARGKVPTATISVRASMRDAGVLVVVEDDGAGVDLPRVRSRAEEMGLLTSGDANVSDARLLELLMHPGFSTRDRVSDVSGRGIGLDAARAAISAVGGSLDVKSTPEVGTTLALRVPQATRSVDVLTFRGVRTPVLFAVPATWSAVVGAPEPVAAVDLAETLALPPTGRPATLRVIELRRDRQSLFIAAGSDPEAVRARRICPTPTDEQVEIVAVGSKDAILVRPDVIVRERRAQRTGV